METLEAGLGQAVMLLKFLLEAISALCVAIGLVSTLRSALKHVGISALRLRFGSWLALALEFQLGADIVATTVAPTFEALAKLALLAVVRTFLNYFLQKELRSEGKDQELAT